MKSRACDVMVFAEDPGAARYVAGLPPALADAGISTRTLATGLATAALREGGTPFESADAGAAALLDRYCPAVLVTGTSENVDTLGLQLIDACRSRGVVSVGAVDAAMNAARRFRGRDLGPLAHAPDYLLVPDAWTAAAFMQLGFASERVGVCGHPNYDRVLDLREQLEREGQAVVRARVLPPQAQGRQVVTFVSEGCARIAVWDEAHDSGSWLDAAPDGVKGRTEQALEMVLRHARRELPDAYVVLRLHPKDDPADFGEFARRVDYLHRGDSALALAHASDLVVGLTSMLLTESFLLGVQTLALIPCDREREWLPAVRAGAAPSVTNAVSLGVALREFGRNGVIQPRAVSDGFVQRGAARRAAQFIAPLVRPASA